MQANYMKGKQLDVVEFTLPEYKEVDIESRYSNREYKRELKERLKGKKE
jgi:hypothetical protein